MEIDPKLIQLGSMLVILLFFGYWILDDMVYEGMLEDEERG